MDSATSTMTLDRNDNFFKGTFSVTFSATLPSPFVMDAVTAVFDLESIDICYTRTLSAPTTGILDFTIASNNGPESLHPTIFII